MALDTTNLKNWFLAKKRDLPWRQLITPYRVWISEVMLQQTQVAVVIPYFLRWMEKFPSVQALAEASLDEVIKAWEGLGYYSRARYLHAGAQYIVTHFQGEFPQDEENLKKIKGLGPYTIGAILSFAFHQKKAAVDGNVLRVLSRYFQIEEDISKSSTLKKLRYLAEQILPTEESWIINEGLIELGATICQKKARCEKCPVQTSCQSYKNGMVDLLPIKAKGASTTYLYRTVPVIVSRDAYLIRRGQKGKIMSDLHEFPFFETTVEASKELTSEFIQTQFGLTVDKIQALPPVSHSFTRYQVQLYPTLFSALDKKPIEGLEWISLSDLKKLAFSSGHRRIFQAL